MYLLNTNYADLSLLFAQDAGAETNAHLGQEAPRRGRDDAGHVRTHLNLHVEDVGAHVGAGRHRQRQIVLSQLPDCASAAVQPADADS